MFQDEELLQLCHYEDFVKSIMERHQELYREATSRLKGSLEHLISRLVDVDFPSPFLEAALFFL